MTQPGPARPVARSSPTRGPVGYTPRPLNLRTRVRLRVTHTVRLVRAVSRFADTDGLWWLLPLIVVLALVAAAATATTTALPLTVYTLF